MLDVHAGGNLTRIVLSGIPALDGVTVAERAAAFATHHDWIRTCLVTEPRGGLLTIAAVIVPPSHSEADLGVFFLERTGTPARAGATSSA